MTRTTDASVSIQQRADIANAAGADVFLPIYFNSWTTPIPDGSVVLYPYARDIPFATDISQAVTNYISPDGDNDGGIVLRNDWWLQPTMPTATIESLFISNPHDAALLTKASFRQGLAEALRNGIETYLPGILQRQQEVRATTPAKLLPVSGPLAVPPTTHATAAAGAQRVPASTAPPVKSAGTPAALQILEVLMLLAAVLLAIRYRHRLVGLAGSGFARVSTRARDSGLHHRTLQRRRRLTRERGLTAAGGGGARSRPAYDDLFAESRGVWDRALPTGHGAVPEDLLSASFEVRGRPVKPARHPALDELPL